jgi:hypothetical protein
MQGKTRCSEKSYTGLGCQCNQLPFALRLSAAASAATDDYALGIGFIDFDRQHDSQPVQRLFGVVRIEYAGEGHRADLGAVELDLSWEVQLEVFYHSAEGFLAIYATAV